MTNLSEQIEAYNEQKAQRVPQEILDLMDLTTEDLIATGMTDKSLKSGDKAIPFTLKNHLGNIVDIQSLLANGKVVLSFYRGGWCPYCNMELKSLQSILPKIEQAGAKLIAISPETPDFSTLTHDKNELKFDILFDQGNDVAKSWGLEFELDARLRPIYEKIGIDVQGHNGDSTFKLPLPATYVINQDGSIAYHFVDADYTKRLEPSEILKRL